MGKKKKKTHFRRTIQICRSEVEQLQIYINNKSVGCFCWWNSNRVAIEQFS